MQIRLSLCLHITLLPFRLVIYRVGAALSSSKGVAHSVQNALFAGSNDRPRLSAVLPTSLIIHEIANQTDANLLGNLAAQFGILFKDTGNVGQVFLSFASPAFRIQRGPNFPP